MKKLFYVLLMLVPVSVLAAGGGNVHLDSADIDLDDQASLQRGAKYFANYCLNCHSAKYMRYQSMTGLGLTEDQMRENLMFAGE